jgi:hypothetical protein
VERGNAKARDYSKDEWEDKMFIKMVMLCPSPRAEG